VTADEERDQLTGSLDSSALPDTLRRELEEAQRRGRAVSVIVFDIDGFTHINEEYGHLVGDDLLVRLAERLRATVRSADIVWQLGGDGFALVVPEATRADAERVAQLFQRQLATRPLHQGIGVAVSWGVAEAGPEDDGVGLLRRADEDRLRRS